MKQHGFLCPAHLGKPAEPCCVQNDRELMGNGNGKRAEPRPGKEDGGKEKRKAGKDQAAGR